MTPIPIDSADARELKDHEPLRGHALATAILAAATARNTANSPARPPTSDSGKDARAGADRGIPGPIQDASTASPQVSAPPEDSESAGTVEAKAHALLVAGRVAVRIGGGPLIVDVEGDSGTHTVTMSAGQWSCNCPAGIHRRRCSHVAAAQLIGPIPAMRQGHKR
jgi:hypothetical protein